jgi:hypothetical protein
VVGVLLVGLLIALLVAAATAGVDPSLTSM